MATDFQWDTRDGLIRKNDTSRINYNGILQETGNGRKRGDEITFPGHARSRSLYSHLSQGRGQANDVVQKSIATRLEKTNRKKHTTQPESFSAGYYPAEETNHVSVREWQNVWSPKTSKSLYQNISPPRLTHISNGAEDANSTVSDMTSSSGVATSAKTSSSSSTSIKCYDCRTTIEPPAKSVKCLTCHRNCHIRCLPQASLPQNGEKPPKWRCRRCIKRQKSSGISLISSKTQVPSVRSESSYSPPDTTTPAERTLIAPISLEASESQSNAAPLGSSHNDQAGVDTAAQEKSGCARSERQRFNHLSKQSWAPVNPTTSEGLESEDISGLPVIRTPGEVPVPRKPLRNLSGMHRPSDADADADLDDESGMNHYSPRRRPDQEVNEPPAQDSANAKARGLESTKGHLEYFTGWGARGHNDQAQNVGGSKAANLDDIEGMNDSPDIVMAQPRNAKGPRPVRSTTKTILSSRSVSTAPSTASNTSGDFQRKEQIDAESGTATTPEEEAGTRLTVPISDKQSYQNPKNATEIDVLESSRKRPYDEYMPLDTGRPGLQSHEISTQSWPADSRPPFPGNSIQEPAFDRPLSPSNQRHGAAAYSQCSQCGKKILASISKTQNPLCTNCKAPKQPNSSNRSMVVPETPQPVVHARETTLQDSLRLNAKSPSLTTQNVSPSGPTKRQMPAPSQNNLFHRSKKPRLSNFPAPINYAPMRKAREPEVPLGHGSRSSTPPDKLLVSPDHQRNHITIDQSPPQAKILELESTVAMEKTRPKALREELGKMKKKHSAAQKSYRQSVDTELQQQREQPRTEIERANALERDLARLRRDLALEQEISATANARADKSEQEKLLLKTQLNALKEKGASPCETNGRQVSMDDHIEQMKAEGVQFEEDSDSESGCPQNVDVSRRENREISCQYQRCSSRLTQFSPGYFLSSFDREAKISEIAARPRRKKTFKRVLPLRHSGRENTPTQRAFEVRDEAKLKFTSTHCEANRKDSGVDYMEEEEELVEDYGTWSEFVGIPKVFVPTLTTEKELAFRDGLRDANGRLPRAREVFKVHDKNAARLG